MKFEEALLQMRLGKKLKLPDDDYYLCMLSRLYFDGDHNRPVEILSTKHHVLREDWEVLDEVEKQ